MTSNTKENAYAIVGYSLKDTLSDHGSVSRGVCSETNGQLDTIEEHTKIHRVDGKIIDEDLGRFLSPDTIVFNEFLGM